MTFFNEAELPVKNSNEKNPLSILINQKTPVHKAFQGLTQMKGVAKLLAENTISCEL